jgi:[protein-PII] uridylyltransferase
MASGSRLRPSVLDVREQLATGRQLLREHHDRGMDGVRVCGRLTSLVDGAIGRLYDAFLAELSEAEAHELRQRAALVAHGGYGRRQQAPYSDVDLMLLVEGKAGTLVTKLAARLTQDICDVGIQLGQSMRTVNQAIELARTDPQIGTSLIESRLLLGSPAVYERFGDALSAMIQRRGPALCRAFIAARRDERLHYGETVYLLEPNVKRSRGGLRDLQLLRWLWLIKCGAGDPERLHNMGVLSKFDYRRLISAQNFVLRVRNEMHFHSADACDALTRSEQLRLAEYFQYRGAKGMRPVEQFMRDYFHHTNHVWHLVNRLSELVQPASRMSKVLEPMFGRTTDDDYHVGREVSATSRAMARLAQHPEEALRLVDLARQEEKRIAQDTWYFVYRTAPQYSNEPTPKLAASFLEIMANPERLGELLRRLHGLGVLEKIIPEFSHARSLLQFNQYHKYTVDEHCIRAVEEVTQFAQREDALGGVYRSLKDKRTLHLALLLHDLGKGYDEDHSEVGREIARRAAERLGLPHGEAQTLEFLVHRHLLMSDLGLKYDTTRPELVARFAKEVGSHVHLDMLYLITCADLAAVGPGVLNSWKVEVLSELYRRASRELTAEERAEVETPSEVDRRSSWEALAPAEQADPWFRRQLDSLPESYLGRWADTAVADTLRRLRNLAPQAGAAWADYLAYTNTVEFVAGIDQGSGRGIFANMAGALTSHGMQILSAETDTLADGLLLLRYVVEDPDYPGEPPPERLERVTRALVASIDSSEPPKFRSVWGRERHEANAALSDLPNEVRIDNDLSAECAVVEVFTIDRRGLLYQLARALHELGLIIQFAKIGTYLDQVVDVFYVAERDGTKPRSAERLEEIRRRLLEIIDVRC